MSMIKFAIKRPDGNININFIGHVEQGAITKLLIHYNSIGRVRPYTWEELSEDGYQIVRISIQEQD